MPESQTAEHRIEAEIFSVGEWNGEHFTRRDLEEIASNFHKLKDNLRPPLKFGHDENQTLLGQRDGDPALGWVEALRVRGERLVATFAGVPGVVAEAIDKGLYRRVSAELYFNLRRKGKKLGKALKAVALLGADLPAVTNLRDLQAYLAIVAPEDLSGSEARVFTWPVPHSSQLQSSSHQEEEIPMPELDIPDTVQEELAELRAYREQQESQEALERQRRKNEAFRVAREQAVSFCEEQVREGRLSPHLRDQLVKEIEGQHRTFTEGNPLRVSFSWVKRLLTGLPVQLPQAELAFSQTEPEAADSGADPSRTLARLAENKMNELNLPYSQAAEYVLRTQPSLARAYREFTLNPIS